MGLLDALSYPRRLRPAASRDLPQSQGQRSWICSCPSGHGCYTVKVNEAGWEKDREGREGGAMDKGQIHMNV